MVSCGGYDFVTHSCIKSRHDVYKALAVECNEGAHERYKASFALGAYYQASH